MSKKVEVEVKEIVSKIQDLSWGSLETAEEQSQDPVCHFEGLGDKAAEVHRWLRSEMEQRDLSHFDNRFRIPESEPEIREESEMDSITIDWREDTIRFYREQLCQAFGLTPEELDSSNSIDAERLLKIAQDVETANALDSERVAVECMEAYITGLNQNTTLNDFRGLRAAIRDLVDSVIASFDTFFKACSSFIEIRVLCVWDEFVWKRERRKRMTDVGWADLHARRQAVVRDRQEQLINSQFAQECPPGVLDPGAAIRNHPYSEFLSHYELNFHSELEQFPSGVIDLGKLTEEEVEVFRTQWERMSRVNAFCTPSRFRLTG